MFKVRRGDAPADIKEEGMPANLAGKGKLATPLKEDGLASQVARERINRRELTPADANQSKPRRDLTAADAMAGEMQEKEER